MLDRNHLLNIDWILILLLTILMSIGVAVIYSSSYYMEGSYSLRQAIFLMISLVVIFLLTTFDYTVYVTYAPYLYIFCLIILVGVLIFGNLIAGTKSWFRLPFFQIQPSELMKLALILMLANLLSGFKGKNISRNLFLMSGALVAIPMILVAVQPDLGTALSMLPIYLGALILAGINKKTLIFLLIAAVILGILGWSFFLKDYQKDRLSTLIFPQQDPLGAGYQVIQSKIAIGSGGVLGKGFTKGTQSQLRFLPARHTDFVFSVIGEEFGFFGISVMLLIYYLFLSRIFKSVNKSRDRTGVYIVFMVAMMIGGQFFVNVFMTIGLFPVAGIPLPFLSYGGSSLLTNAIAVSLVVNVKMRRFVNV